MAGIKDVAREAGVSASTVSYVLSGKRSISAKTTGKVMAAVEKLGYTPDASARKMRGMRNQIIALSAPIRGDINQARYNAYFLRTAWAARNAGYDVMLLNGNRNVLPFEVGQSLRFGLGGDDEPETAVVRRGVRGRRHNSLRRAAFILHEDVDDVPEMPAQRPRPHGGTELQRALEGDKLHFQPLLGEQAFVCRDVQDDGVGGGEDAKLERGAVRGLDGGKDEQGKED